MALKTSNSSRNKDKFNFNEKTSDSLPEHILPGEMMDLRESKKQTELSKEQVWYGKWTFILTIIILLFTGILVLKEFEIF